MGDKRNESYLVKAAFCNDIDKTFELLAEGYNHYSAILSDLVSSVPSIDHPILVSLMRSYAEGIERHHPGTKEVSLMMEAMLEQKEICIKVPMKDE